MDRTWKLFAAKRTMYCLPIYRNQPETDRVCWLWCTGYWRPICLRTWRFRTTNIVRDLKNQFWFHSNVSQARFWNVRRYGQVESGMETIIHHTYRTDILKHNARQQDVNLHVVVVVVCERVTNEGFLYFYSPFVIFIVCFFLTQISTECGFWKRLCVFKRYGKTCGKP